MTPSPAAFMTFLLSLPPFYCHRAILCKGGQNWGGEGAESEREGVEREREGQRGRGGVVRLQAGYTKDK